MYLFNRPPHRAAHPRLSFFIACALLAAFPPQWSALAAKGPQGGATRFRITTATGVRLRQAPQTAAEELTRLALGVAVQELERSAAREKVGSSEDYWYRVAAPGGLEGWVFGALTAPFDPERRAETYLKIAADRLKVAEASFGERADLFKFLDRVAPEVKGRDALAELELLRLLALHKSLEAIPFDKQGESPYKDWTKEHEARAVYSEPAGQWLIRADALWALEKKYRGLPVAERIAWEASRIGLPGECEGFLPCYFGYHSLTDGQYLKLYPRGAHAGEALGSLSEFLDGVLEDLKGSDPHYEVPAEDLASFHKELAELRATVARVPNPKGGAVLRKLDQLAARFR